MKNGFDIDNPFFAFMGALADVVIVNLLFLICSVPIITMGASMCAMYETMRGMRKGGVSSVCRYFFAAFRSSFKKSLPAWVLQFFTGILLLFDLNFIGMMPKSAAWNIIGMFIGALLLLWMMITCYLLPAGVYHSKKLKDALTHSLYLAVRNFPCTIVMVISNSIPFACLLAGSYFIGMATPVYIAVGFGATAYFNTILLGKCKDLTRDPVRIDA